MTGSPSRSLGQLLAPVGVREFLDRIWAKAPHHIDRGDSGYFDGLLGDDAVEGLLTNLRHAPDVLRVVKGAEHRDTSGYLLCDGGLDVTRARADLDDGYTLILNNIERHLPEMTALTHSIEVELNFPTHLNAYITPPGSVGFLPHYDHHDVLALQIQGEKTWHFYGESAVAPHILQQHLDVDHSALPESRTLRLAAGDTLYVPRGQIHSAETGSGLSVHLTVGIHVPTVLTVLTHALHLLSLHDDRVHTRLPAHHLDDPRLRADIGELIGEALDVLAAAGSIDKGLEAMQDLLVRRGRCPTVGRAADTADIGGHTRLVKHQPLYARVVTAPGGVALQFAQLLVRAGTDHEAALRFLAGSCEPFRVCELPGLRFDQQRELVRSLIASGYLIRQPDEIERRTVDADAD